MSHTPAPMPEVAADALAGRVVLVTGAHGGLGAEAAKACARAGATVVLLGRKLPKLNRVYDAVKALGPEPALYPVDLAGADPADYAQLAEKIASELGGLHGVLHCAAEFTGLAPLEATEPEAFVRCLHVNLTAPWLLTQACLPWLRKSGDSAVVFTTDDPARVGKAYWGASGLAKPGLAEVADVGFDGVETETAGDIVRPGADPRITVWDGMFVAFLASALGSAILFLVPQFMFPSGSISASERVPDWLE
mgnify:CR=1 FL=1